MSDTWIDVRRKAREFHALALAKAKDDRRAEALVAAALELDDLALSMFDRGVAYGTEVLGALDRINSTLKVVRGLDKPKECVVIAHEIGHFKLHQDPTAEVTLTPRGLGGDPLETGEAKVEGYSPRERQEVQADIFASEFLCPGDWLRAAYLDGRRPKDIATELGLPPELIVNQAVRALLLPPLSPMPAAMPPTPPIALDPSQHTAANWTKGPLLVEAGPGTGKTRTLVERVRFLLTTVSPGSILALTFSNKAADEMRERIALIDPDAAIQMWTSTFHHFGMELITKWPSSVGRTADVRILDETGSLELLENYIDQLPLRHYQNMYEPALELVHVLRAISRCKDEQITPTQYKKAADEALTAARAAGDQEATESAEKSVEIGEIYAIYQELLQKADAVDFGDLILLATQLIETNADVKAHIAKYKDILVDEYQDTNSASAALLKAITKNGGTVWVVGDQRQSIYRFRGAQPANMAEFEKTFGGKRHALAHNYRSFAPVVRTFESFSTAMGDGTMAGKWDATRAAGGEVTLTVAPTLSAEAEAIKDKIEELRDKGIPYREQAIVARTHLTLARITSILEELGVPLLYLGDLFERHEIKDLLCLIALGVESGNVGLVRVAALSAYDVPRDDALLAIRWAQENQISIFDTLRRAAEINSLSERGRHGLKKLGDELAGLEYAPAWAMLTVWLFERSDYLRPLLKANDPVSQQALIAIYHFLKMCGDHIHEARGKFLGRIRRIEALNYDSTYRAVSAEAADLDAVRVMTIHGSKGLEFQAVHVPALATRYMPTTRQWVRCPPPPSLAHLATQPSDHDDEEAGLFFVALSRARDYLSLSRAEKYTSTRASASKFLTAITKSVHQTTFAGSGKNYTADLITFPQEPSEAYGERELETYMQCPARYKYEVIEDLNGLRDGSPYVKFHRCVYRIVSWLEQQRIARTPADGPAALAQLKVEWSTRGPVGYPFESYYLKAAEAMVMRMADAIATETGQYDRKEWAVDLDGRIVTVTPDRLLVQPDGVHVQRVRTGRKTKSEPEKPLYALLRRAAERGFPGRPVTIETYYLATGETVIVPAKNEDKKLTQYRDAIVGIEAGHFPPEPEARRCASCQSYFLCGA